jgi:hypothetical protein
MQLNKHIVVKRGSFVSSSYSVFLDGKGPAYFSKVKFTWHDPKEIIINSSSNRSDEIIHMKPMGAADKKTGYGERAEYSIQNWGGEPFGFLEIVGRVNPEIRILDEKRNELGVFKERSALYSIARTLMRNLIPNYYVCSNGGVTLFTASEVYTPIMCRVSVQVKEPTHQRMNEFVICTGLWVACTPSY